MFKKEMKHKPTCLIYVCCHCGESNETSRDGSENTEGFEVVFGRPVQEWFDRVRREPPGQPSLDAAYQGKDN